MNKLMLGAILTAIVHCGCSHYYYVANVQNVPLFQEKDDLRISAFWGAGDESFSIEAQTAYSAGKKIGLMADFMTAWGGKASDNDFGRGIYLDGGIGYFTPLGQAFAFEVYGGAGISSQHHEYDQMTYDYSTGAAVNQYGGTSDLSFAKLFIQPSIGIKQHPLEVALSARTCRLSYYRVINNMGIVELDHLNDKAHYLFEPAVTFRVGWENVKLQAQLSRSLYLGDHSYFSFEEIHLSGGVVFNIPAEKRD